MTREDIFEMVKSVIVDQLDVELEKITLEALFLEDLGADSLDLVEVIMALEEKIEVNIPDEDAEKILTVGDAVEYIYKIAGK